LLGSFNLVTYLNAEERHFDWAKLVADIPHVVRAMDNVVDRAVYPLPEQEREAKTKRRMGLGITGLANAAEFLGYPYGSEFFLKFQSSVMELLRDEIYMASANLAAEKGVFPLYDKRYLMGRFFKTLAEPVKERISKVGIRNSHLLSIAPTGTISLTANNVSSGIEPVFLQKFERTVQSTSGATVEVVEDYGTKFLGVHPKTASDCTVEDHVNTLLVASKYVDSAVSKTCNVGDDVTLEQFKDVYWKAWKGGAKGCTTFRAAGKREGILREIKDTESGDTAFACEFDPETGRKSCDS
jgi:ribonucleoside-diphosphate reductase alpha chain